MVLIRGSSIRDPYFLPLQRKVPARHRPILKGGYLISYFYFQRGWQYTAGIHFIFIHYRGMVYISPRQRALSDKLNTLVTKISDDGYGIKEMPSDMML